MRMATLVSPAPNDQHRVPLSDAFGRRIDYLRVSLTDRCDLRCVYCMDAKPVFLDRRGQLSPLELAGIVGAFVARGVRRVRLTGGEPLTRRDIADIVASLGALRRRADAAASAPGLDELTLTTNGTQLARYAVMLAAAGIARINVSLDTLDPLRFAEITRGGRLDQVLTGIDAAVAAGLTVRINMVAMAGFNDAALPAMADWCEARGFDLALIESMPMGGVDAARARSHIALDRFLAPLLPPNGRPVPIAHSTAGPARYVSVPGRALRIGLITPISNNFCSQCNRVRLTSEGKVHGCLGFDDAIDLAAGWRAGGAAGIDPLLDRLMAVKAERHDFAIGPGLAQRGPARHMYRTGG